MKTTFLRTDYSHIPKNQGHTYPKKYETPELPLNCYKSNYTYDVKRGEIYRCQLPDSFGSKQYGRRPVVIIQNDVGNFYSHTTIVAPITSAFGRRPKQNIETHVDVSGICGLYEGSTILLEQIQVIDKNLLETIMVVCPENVISEINYKIAISLGLTKPYNKKTSINCSTSLRVPA